MPKIKVTVSTGFANCTHVDYQDIDDDEWAAMTENEQGRLLEDMAIDLQSNHVECSAFVVEKEGNDNG